MYIGDVHDGSALAPSGVGSRRQRRRRAPGRLIARASTITVALRRLGHGRGRRSRHPGRHHAGPRRQRGRGRDDGAARRRQVRPLELQGQRRSARRRRQRRQRRQRVRCASRSSARASSGSRSTTAACPSGARRRSAKRSDTGTKITFKPDHEIFTNLEYSFDILANRLRELAFLNSGLIVDLKDERGEGRSEHFEYQGGIKEFVSLLSQAKEPVHDDVVAFTGEWPSTRRQGPRVGRFGDSVDQRLRRADPLLHEQRPQQGRRHPPHRPAHAR